MTVKSVVVAPDYQRAMHLVREQGWNPRDVVVVTPGQGFRVRGLNGVPVHWTDWPRGGPSLTFEDQMALQSITY